MSTALQMDTSRLRPSGPPGRLFHGDEFWTVRISGSLARSYARPDRSERGRDFTLEMCRASFFGFERVEDPVRGRIHLEGIPRDGAFLGDCKRTAAFEERRQVVALAGLCLEQSEDSELHSHLIPLQSHFRRADGSFPPRPVRYVIHPPMRMVVRRAGEEWQICVVANHEGVVLGLPGQEALRSAGNVPAENAMHWGRAPSDRWGGPTRGSGLGPRSQPRRLVSIRRRAVRSPSAGVWSRLKTVGLPVASAVEGVVPVAELEAAAACSRPTPATSARSAVLGRPSGPRGRTRSFNPAEIGSWTRPKAPVSSLRGGQGCFREDRFKKLDGVS